MPENEQVPNPEPSRPEGEGQFQVGDQVSVKGREGIFYVKNILPDGQVIVLGQPVNFAQREAADHPGQAVGIWEPLTVDPAQLTLVARAGEY